MRPGDDPGWESYGSTILVVHAALPFEIDLSMPVNAPARALLAGAGLAEPFGLVTPCNPRGQHAAQPENDALLNQFLADFTADGSRYVRVDGVSPDRRHVEPGVALAWPQPDVVALARKWRQSAVYWWDGAAFWVVGALTDAAPRRLGIR